jgi:putative redox protein
MTEPAGHSPPKRQNRVEATWAGDQEFDTGRPGGPRARLDGHGKSAQSPVDALLSALAACTSIDVVEILAKRRTPVEALRVLVAGDRANATPARVTRILLTFHIDGEGIERVHAERAVELAVTKYCSVRESLDPAIPIEWAIVLNGVQAPLSGAVP